MNKKVIILIAIAVVLLGCFVWVKNAYNSLVTSDENAQSAWSQVENVYQRRADLIPNLVATVKGYAAPESPLHVLQLHFPRSQTHVLRNPLL